MPNVDSIINALSGIGQSKAVVEGKPDSPLSKLLVDLAQDVTNELTANIDKYDIKASGNLKQSIKPTTIKLDGDTLSIGVEADFYWKFLNYGVNGTLNNVGAPSWGSTESTGKSFEQSIDEWIRNRGITLPPNFSSYESLNYVIRRSIREKGIKPRPFFTDVINENIIDTVKAPVEKLLGKSISIIIKEPFE